MPTKPYRRPEDKGSPTEKKFDGKVYGLTDTIKYKFQATDKAKRYRRLGISARIVKVKNGKGGYKYLIYTRRRKK